MGFGTAYAQDTSLSPECQSDLAPSISELQGEINAVPALMKTPTPPSQYACLGSLLNGISFGFPMFNPMELLKALMEQACSAVTSVVNSEIDQVVNLDQLLQMPYGLGGLQIAPNGSGGFSINTNDMSNTAAGDIWNQINQNVPQPGYNWTNSIVNGVNGTGGSNYSPPTPPSNGVTKPPTTKPPVKPPNTGLGGPP